MEEAISALTLGENTVFFCVFNRMNSSHGLQLILCETAHKSINRRVTDAFPVAKNKKKNI